MAEKESKLTESEKAIINDIYNSVVQYAHSSHITSLIYRKYPEAFFKPTKIVSELNQNATTDTHTKNIIVSTKTTDNVFYNHYVENIEND